MSDSLLQLLILQSAMRMKANESENFTMTGRKVTEGETVHVKNKSSSSVSLRSFAHRAGYLFRVFLENEQVFLWQIGYISKVIFTNLSHVHCIRANQAGLRDHRTPRKLISKLHLEIHHCRSQP